MRWLIRPFTVLVSLGWLGFWLGALWLLWRTDRYATLHLGSFDATGDIASDSTARWVASPWLVLAAAAALPVLLGAFLPHHRRTPRAAATGEALAPPVRPATPESATVPTSLRTATPAPDVSTQLERLTSRVESQEQQLRDLRALVARSMPPRAGEPAPKEPALAARD